MPPKRKAGAQAKLSFAAPKKAANKAAAAPKRSDPLAADSDSDDDDFGVAATATPAPISTLRRNAMRTQKKGSASGVISLDDLLEDSYKGADPIEDADGGSDESSSSDDDGGGFVGGGGGLAERRRRKEAAQAAERVKGMQRLNAGIEATLREVTGGEDDGALGDIGDGSAEEVLEAPASEAARHAPPAPAPKLLGVAGAPPIRADAGACEEYAGKLLAQGWLADLLAPPSAAAVAECRTAERAAKKPVARSVVRWLFGLVEGDAARHRQAALALAAALGVDWRLAGASPVAAVCADGAPPRELEWFPTTDDFLAALAANGYMVKAPPDARIMSNAAYAPAKGVPAAPDAAALDRISSILLVAAAAAASELASGIPLLQDDTLLELLVVAARLLALDVRACAARPTAEAAVGAMARCAMQRGGEVPQRAACCAAECASRPAAVAEALRAIAGAGAPSAAARALSVRAARIALHEFGVGEAEPADAREVLALGMKVAVVPASDASRVELLMMAAHLSLVNIGLGDAGGFAPSEELEQSDAFDAFGVETDAPASADLVAFLTALNRMDARVKRTFQDDGRPTLKRTADYVRNRLKERHRLLEREEQEALERATPTRRPRLAGAGSALAPVAEGEDGSSSSDDDDLFCSAMR